MSGKFRKKFQSNKGASLIVALLFFMMCAFAGSVILASASAAAGRVRKLKSTTQTQAALESAARLICSLLEDDTARTVDIQHELSFGPAQAATADTADTFVSSIQALTKKMYSDQWSRGGGYSTVIKNSSAAEYTLSEFLTDGTTKTRETITHVHKDHNTDSAGSAGYNIVKTYTITPESADGNRPDDISVHVDVYIYRDYQIDMVLKQSSTGDASNNESSDDGQMQLTITLPNADLQCVVTEASIPSESGTKTGRYVHTIIQLGKPQISYE